MKGDILAVSPWVEEDPNISRSEMSLAERRAALELVARQLLPGGSCANQYPESVIWADVEVPVW
jgi:hypothetical protein